jgi:hypothetical protein
LLDSNRKIDLQDVQPLLQYLQETLSLHQWRLKFIIIPSAQMGNDLMRIKPNRNRLIATIEIKHELIGKPLSEFGPLLLHELIHLIMEPIAEEHQFQCEQASERYKEYQKRFVRSMEKVVEVLSLQFSKLIELE